MQRYELDLLFSGKETQGRMTKAKYFNGSYDRKSQLLHSDVMFLKYVNRNKIQTNDRLLILISK